MRLGLIARADDRGLGIQTWEAWRHLRPERTLVVDVGKLTPYAQHFDRYPGARIAQWDGTTLTPQSEVDWLLEGVDVVLACETAYDVTFYDQARARGVRTVLQANPEFFRYVIDPKLTPPDLVVNPTTWRIDRMLPGTVHLPHAVARDRLPFRHRTAARTFLHVVGHQAMADRAGTMLLAQALRHITKPLRVVVRSQSPLRAGTFRPRPRGAEVEVVDAALDNYWDLYANADVLVAPRRYGGQSLPINEALSTGMPVITLDRAPEQTWGGVLTVPSMIPRQLRTQAGRIDCHSCRPVDLAAAMERLAVEPELVSTLSKEADEYASTISWEAMVPRYLEVFRSLVR